MQPFSATVRTDVLENCAQAKLDIAIIGGGITGAGCLRDAALRGLRVALFEKNDFGSGTSGYSSKLIHGGLRYLETGDFKLVFEANRERHTLLKIAPKLVKPLPFMFPVYRGHRRGLPAITVGVALYYLLAMPKNIGRPNFHLKERTLELEPALRSLGLRGCATYYDGVTNDTALTLATVKSGWAGGGLAVNHAEVMDLIQEGSHIIGLRAQDVISKKSYSIHARWIVNASGPWSDLVRAKLPTDVEPGLRLTKGAHLVIEKKRFPVEHAIVMLAPSDGRVTFVIPWEEHTLVGTTDTDFQGKPEDVSTDASDVSYLLDAVNYHFPQIHLSRPDIVSTFAGLRPLIRDNQRHPSKVSREHRIFSDRPGLVSITGGKLTSYRQMAEELLDWVMKHTPEWQNRFAPCRTAQAPLEVTSVKPLEDSITTEMAATIEDILARRTRLLILDRKHGLNFVSEISKLLQTHLGYSEGVLKEQLRAYEEIARKAIVS